MSNNDETLDKKLVCIHQAFRNKKQYGGIFTPKGWGDCSQCHYDPINNKRCLGYYPIILHIIYHEEKTCYCKDKEKSSFPS